MAKRYLPSRSGQAGAKIKRPVFRGSRFSQNRQSDGPNWQIISAIVAGVVVVLIIGGVFIVNTFFKPAEPLVTATAVVAISATPVETPLSTTTPLPVATDTPQPVAASPKPLPDALPPDIPALQQYMLQLINQDRNANGLSEVGWDSTASAAGQGHAQEMAQFLYFSHWNLDGYGPDYRYSLAGGLDNSRENVYLSTITPGFGPTSLEEWKEWVREAQQGLMNSEGHRQNILAPEHTHVGIGLAYNSEMGRFTLVQEFVDHYVKISSIPSQVTLGYTINISGKLLPGASDPAIALGYEVFPSKKTVEELNKTGTYIPAVEIYETIPVITDDKGNFNQDVVLNSDNRSGLYHLIVWVDTVFGQVTALDIIIRGQ